MGPGHCIPSFHPAASWPDKDPSYMHTHCKTGAGRAQGLYYPQLCEKVIRYCCGRRIQVPPSHPGNHMTHHPSFSFHSLHLTFGYSNTWLKCRSLHTGGLITCSGRGQPGVLTHRVVCSQSVLYPWATSAGLGRLGMFVNSRVGRQPPGH